MKKQMQVWGRFVYRMVQSDIMIILLVIDAVVYMRVLYYSVTSNKCLIFPIFS